MILPEGPAVVKVWHGAQILDKAPQSITITGTPGTVSFQLDVVPSAVGGFETSMAASPLLAHEQRVHKRKSRLLTLFH